MRQCSSFPRFVFKGGTSLSKAYRSAGRARCTGNYRPG
ncbi:nucleotidyl transferase AbiEii/AbiGii toxin family protein [Rhizobium sp. CG4]|nr:nucleotidyl transferase AbiEii/AbiGii toxin family protein [Rhizobium sp. CG4]